MMNIQTLVRLPFLWGRTAFKKEHWSQINLIVGPNGSGKTLLAQELAVQFQAAGLKVSFLRSEKTDEDKLLHTLKDKCRRQGKNRNSSVRHVRKIHPV